MAKSLLLADDSATFHKVVTQVLSQEDVTVTAVKSGDEAIAKALTLRPDAVLADTFMPGGKSGYDVAAALRANPATAHIPVLLLASPNEPFDEAKARASGAVGQLPKPFQSQALIDQVKNLLSGARPAPAPSPAPAPPAPVAKTMPPPPAKAPPPPPPAAKGPPPPPAAAMAKSVAPPARPAGPPPAPGAAPVAKTAAPPPRPPGAPGAPVPGAAAAKGPPPPPGAVAQKSVAPLARPAVPGAPTQPAPARPAGVAPAGAVAKGPPPPPGAVAKGPPPAGAPVARPPAQQLTAANHEALLREALSKATKEMIEKVIWEVVPELAETMIKEELAKLVKARGG